jgi:alkanesulfonate monooxygenase SsuD/methylene tetrahydromethanopterin reductase-like flavin-dependent oxidoreductase (luciferase family)
MTSPDVSFGLWYDFRNPRAWRRPFESLYRDVLRQIVWAEEIGFDSVWLTEHHFCDDGYTPSPLVILGSIGASTSRLRLGTNLMLLPLHDPVRLAEDAATLSLLTGGRFDLGVGLGYRQIEFEAFKRSLVNRPSLMEEGVDIIRRAWAGESIACEGKRFRYPDIVVEPLPEHTPKLLIGGMAEPAIERVARIGDGFLSTQNEHHEIYVNALEALGKDSAKGEIYAGQWCVIAEDPEAAWARIGDHAVYQLNEYISWGAFGPPDQVPQFENRDQIAQAGVYKLWDADAAVNALTELVLNRPQIRDVHLFAQLPGEPVESGSERIEYVASSVLPRIRERLRDRALDPA